MFIAHCKDKTYIEGQNGINWDKVPDGISSLEISTFAGELITLPKCHTYFYSTEAVSTVAIGSKLSHPQPPVVTAKIIGGIFNKDDVIYLRIDTRGHINIKFMKKKDLPFADFVYKKST